MISPRMQEFTVPISPAGTVQSIRFGTCGRGRPYTAMVLLKGCLLHCPWCNRPAAMLRDLRVMVDAAKCIGREACGVADCGGRKNLAALRGMRLEELRQAAVVAACPTGALQPDGGSRSVEAVVREVLEHPAFQRRKRRQVVLSGGEPMQQFRFLKRLLKAFRRDGVRCVLDTAAMASWRRIEQLLPLVDRFRVDVKIIDCRRHEELCGEENFPILENIRRLCHRRADVVLTLPLIPGYTDTKQNLKDIGDFIKSLKPRPQLVLLPYSPGGAPVYSRLGIAYPLPAEPLAADDARKALSYFRRRRIHVSRQREII